MCVSWILIVFAEWNGISLDSKYRNAFKFCSPAVKCHEHFLKFLFYFCSRRCIYSLDTFGEIGKQKLKILLSTLVSYCVLTAVVL